VPDRGVKELAMGASDRAHKLFALYRRDPAAFRYEVELLLAPVAGAHSFIHAEKCERVSRIRELLVRTLREIAPR
jgi:hypothetical protein